MPPGGRAASQVTGFVVVDPERRLLGLLTARDLLAGEGPDRVDALMTPREKLVTADAGIGLEEARRLLTSNRVEKLPLVDADDRVAGSDHAAGSGARRPLPARDA